MRGKLGEHTTMPPQLVMCHIYLVTGLLIIRWCIFFQQLLLRKTNTRELQEKGGRK